MNGDIGQTLLEFSIWALPVLIAVTLHEAAHGFAAWRLGDDTAYRMGRVTLNPLRHVDPFGTILLPGLLMLAHSPFLFGYAKPVPVVPYRLDNPRWGMVVVAAAGPAMNILLAASAWVLLDHVVGLLPAFMAAWTDASLKAAVAINLMLAVFNLLPLPPLDGGRILVGLLPYPLARPVARLERYGLPILLVLILVLPWIGQQIGVDLDIVRRVIAWGVNGLADVLAFLLGG